MTCLCSPGHDMIQCHFEFQGTTGFVAGHSYKDMVNKVIVGYL